MVEIWGMQNETKNDRQQNVFNSLAGSYSSPQETTAREIEGGSWWGVWRRRVRQPAAPKATEIAEILQFMRGSLIHWVHHRWKNGFH